MLGLHQTSRTSLGCTTTLIEAPRPLPPQAAHGSVPDIKREICTSFVERTDDERCRLTLSLSVSLSLSLSTSLIPCLPPPTGLTYH